MKYKVGTQIIGDYYLGINRIVAGVVTATITLVTKHDYILRFVYDNHPKYNSTKDYNENTLQALICSNTGTWRVSEPITLPDDLFEI